MTDHIPARTAWGEARNQGVTGMTAVLNVVRNRAVEGGWWGSTLDAVCQHPKQFSCWNYGDPNRAKLLAVNDRDPQFAEALRLEAEATAGSLQDITGGADSYYAVRSPMPAWVHAPGVRETKVIGGQAFYETRELAVLLGRMLHQEHVAGLLRATAPAPRYEAVLSWLRQPTTLSGIALMVGTATAAVTHHIGWGAVPVGLIPGLVLLVPEKDKALRDPLAAVLRDLMPLIAGQLSPSLVPDSQALLAALLQAINANEALPQVDDPPAPVVASVVEPIAA